jgi:hypothetical protein
MQETCGPIYETSCLEWTGVNSLVFFVVLLLLNVFGHDKYFFFFIIIIMAI